MGSGGGVVGVPPPRRLWRRKMPAVGIPCAKHGGGLSSECARLCPPLASESDCFQPTGSFRSAPQTTPCWAAKTRTVLSAPTKLLRRGRCRTRG